jgi:hypothetical protein
VRNRWLVERLIEAAAALCAGGKLYHSGPESAELYGGTSARKLVLRSLKEILSDRMPANERRLAARRANGGRLAL